MSIVIGLLLFLFGGFVGVAVMSIVQIGAAADRDASSLHDLSKKE
ncbi:DUF3789 domain-containing protein [Enterococcus raffinosus]|nr:DUF3789 domain-containing protein [Enterococcus raffinosus]MBU5359616.1 DUF3789 domain-containing protein [Enterococcus raffinosus]